MVGFLSRLFGGDNTKAEASNASTAVRTNVHIGHGWDDIEVEGESYRRGEIAAVFGQLERPEGGVTMQVASLVPEPNNPHDRNAVKVIILGQHVGYVPIHQSRTVARACQSVGKGNVAVAPARVWARNDDGVWRARVTLSFSGQVDTERDYAADRRAAEEYEEERARKALERDQKRRLEEAKRLAGVVEGQWWATHKGAIAELKRQKRYEDARALIDQCIGAAERAAEVVGARPDAWPTEQMSVVLRKLKDSESELTYLERYVAACGAHALPDGVAEKVTRARVAAQAIGS